jgi:four helix bundle protein
MELAEISYQLTRQLPKEEIDGMISKIRTAAVSIPADIAEGYGRENRGEYIQFLKIAQGSLKKLETHLLLIEKLKMSPSETLNPALNKCELLQKMLFSLIHKLQEKPVALSEEWEIYSKKEEAVSLWKLPSPYSLLSRNHD